MQTATKHLVAKQCLRINIHSSCKKSCFLLQNYHTTVARQCNTIITLTPILVLNDSANIRTILCSSSAASCKSLLVGQELRICLFHYLHICSLECDSFGTSSTLSTAVHNLLLSCLLHSQIAMFAVITVILLAFNASAAGLFWNSLKLLCTFSCIFQVSWERVPYKVTFRLKKRMKSLWAKSGKADRALPRRCAWTRAPWFASPATGNGSLYWTTSESQAPTKCNPKASQDSSINSLSNWILFIPCI
jgi:hypothetical protein